MSFLTGEKNSYVLSAGFSALRDYFYLDAFWRVNLGMCIIKKMYSPCLAFVVIWPVSSFVSMT